MLTQWSYEQRSTRTALRLSAQNIETSMGWFHEEVPPYPPPPARRIGLGDRGKGTVAGAGSV